MIRITPSLSIEENELHYEPIHAAGPGGQNVNKVATAVQLRFNLHGSSSLSPQIKARLASLAGRRMNQDGILVIVAKRYRSQQQNRQDAVRRLIVLIRQSLTKPRPRRATLPTQNSHRRRLEAKRRHARIKKLRSVKPLSSD
jgi:ribosome-associated protein